VNAADSDFFRAFAGRVRQQLATNTREGGPTMSATDIAETTTTVPATLQAAPDAPCEAHTWCIKTGAHVDHFGREVSLPAGEGVPPVMEAYLYSGEDTGLPTLTFDRGHSSWQEYASGDQLREETAKVRAHLARLDAFADEFDAIREANSDVMQTEGPFDPSAIRRIVSEAAALSEGSVLLMKQYGEVLRVAFDPDRIDEGHAREVAARRLGLDPAAFVDVEPPAPSGRQWTITTDAGVKVSGYLPAWASEDPSKSVPANKLEFTLDDLTFGRRYTGPTAKVNAPLGIDGARTVEDSELFHVAINCAPYSQYADERTPYAEVAVLEDCVIEKVGPDELAKLAEQLRAQADVLAQAARDLAIARADWAANGGTAK